MPPAGRRARPRPPPARRQSPRPRRRVRAPRAPRRRLRDRVLGCSAASATTAPPSCDPDGSPRTPRSRPRGSGRARGPRRAQCRAGRPARGCRCRHDDRGGRSPGCSRRPRPRAGLEGRLGLRLVQAQRARQASRGQVGVGPGLRRARSPRRLDLGLERRAASAKAAAAMSRLLHARDRGAGQAAAVGLVPAVAARVLAARQAEVEGLVERVELVGDGRELLLAARLGHRLGERRVVRQDEVLHALAERAHLADPRSPRCGRLERVSRAAPFAERLGEDFGQVSPPQP